MCVETGLELDIVIPTALHHPMIHKGSGIVIGPRFTDGQLDGHLPAGGRTIVFFEGFTFNQYSELDTEERYKQAIIHAGGRAAVSYPTVAMIAIEAKDLTVVGTYLCTNQRGDRHAITLDNETFVTQWCNNR